MKETECKELNKLTDSLLSAVVHDLRTPLAAIKGYSSMMLDYFPNLSVEEIKEYIQSIDNATDNLTALVDNLLDASRLEAGLLKLEKTPVNIVNFIKEAVKEAGTRDKHHEILVALEKDFIRICIDQKRIRQVLDNLIDNAAKVSAPETEILISAKNDGQELTISVTDRDTRIPAGELNDFFGQTDRTGQELTAGANNVNLFLYISQKLVKAHGGRFWAKGAAGKGNTVFFTLPLAPLEKTIMN